MTHEKDFFREKELQEDRISCVYIIWEKRIVISAKKKKQDIFIKGVQKLKPHLEILCFMVNY